MSPIQKGIDLALDRILKGATIERVTGVPEPEQLEKLAPRIPFPEREEPPPPELPPQMTTELEGLPPLPPPPPLPPEKSFYPTFGEFNLSPTELQTADEYLKEQMRAIKGIPHIGEAVANLAFGDSFEALEPWQQQIAILAGELPLWLAIPGGAQLRLALSARIAVSTSLAAIKTMRFAKGALLPIAVLERIIAETVKAPFRLTRGGIRQLAELASRRIGRFAEERGGIRLPERKPTPPKAKVFPAQRIPTTEAEIKQEILRLEKGIKAFQEIKTPSLEQLAAYDTMRTNLPILKAKLGALPKVPKAPPPTAPEVPISTAPQRIEAHNIARRKALLDEAGKPKQGYRRLAKAMTGKTSTTKMTEEEAGAFIKALEELPEATIRGRKKIPPRIPITKRVVPEEFFKVKFGEPTPARLFTSQTYYSQKLGVKPLTEPLELAKQRFDLEFQAWSNVVDKKIIQIDKLAGTTIKEKAAAKLKNRPTKAVERMRNLLDEFEEPPPDLTPQETEIFRWFRNTSRTLLKGENEVRRQLGMEEIPYRQAYVRHVADNTAKEILEGTHPLPEPLKYWSQRIVGKKIFNPMEMQRQLSDDLAEYFTRDLGYATKSMLNTGLKEIHLSQPLEAFKQQMGAYSKLMPASTQKWVTDFINQVIKGQQTGLDAEVNRLVTKTGIGSLFDKMLKPFGRTIGRKPLTNLAQLMGRATILSVMTPRPGLAKMIIRNLFQHTQDMALYGIKASLKAYQPARGTLKGLLDESLFLKGYTGIEELPAGAMAKMEKFALKPYGASAVFNAKMGMKTAFHNVSDLITSPKYKNLGWADPKRTFTEPPDFFYQSERVKLLKEMEFGAGITQYSYIPMGMPEIFRHKVLIPLTRLQSWWMNHFFKFHREAMSRTLNGKTSYGAELPWSMRLNYLKYLTLGGGILTAMGYEKSFVLGVLPYNLSPVGQFMIGTYNYATAASDWAREKAKRTIFNSWRAFVPGSLAWKEFIDVWNGDRPLRSIFFYEAEEELPPHIPTWGIPFPEEKEPTGGREERARERAKEIIRQKSPSRPRQSEARKRAKELLGR